MPQRQNSIKAALAAVTSAIRAEACGELSAEEKSAAVNQAMDVVDDSDFVTVAEMADEAIEEKIALEAAVAEQAAIEQADEQPDEPTQQPTQQPPQQTE